MKYVLQFNNELVKALRCHFPQAAPSAIPHLLLLVVLSFPAGCESEPSQSRTKTLSDTSSYSDASPQLQAPEFTPSESFAELNVVYDSGKASGMLSILESLGGGVGLEDFDNDGWLDLVLPGGGSISEDKVTGLPTRFIRQVAENEFRDCSAESEMAPQKFYSHGVACGDINCDGFSDVLITGYGGLTCWLNNGDGTFSEITQTAGLSDDSWSSSAAWGDFNNDGLLDLYVAHYVDWSLENNPPCRGPSGKPDVCGPKDFQGLDDIFYINRGDGTFENATKMAGLEPGGKGLGVVAADYDLDGDLDIYVANDTVTNFLYVNNGSARFEENATVAGLATDDMANANGSMGLAVSDFNQDGLPDIWVTNYEDELTAIYRNLGQMNFLYDSRKAGLNRLGKLFVGFGCVAGDFDADGDEDVAIANGHVVHHPTNASVRQRPLLLLNHNHDFVKAKFSEGSYFQEGHIGRGLATGDINRDGLLDLVFVNTLEPTTLLYGQTSTDSQHYQVKLVGTKSNRNGIGASVSFQTNLGQRTRFVTAGMGYLSSSPNEIHVAIPNEETLQEIQVNWPSGLKTSHIPEVSPAPASSETFHQIRIVE